MHPSRMKRKGDILEMYDKGTLTNYHIDLMREAHTRDQQFHELKEAGLTFNEIGTKHGVSWQTAKIYCDRYLLRQQDFARLDAHIKEKADEQAN